MDRSYYHDTTDGTIHYIMKPGKGKTIVAIHGVGSNHTVWTHALCGLPNPMILIDLHGHGKSQAEWTHLDDTIRDIITILHKENIKEPILLGNSLGSSIAIRLSAKIHASKLILVSPYLEEILRAPRFQKIWLSLFSWIRLPFTPKHVNYADYVGRPAFFYTMLDLQRTSISTWTTSAKSGMQVRASEIPTAIPVHIIIGSKDTLLRGHNIISHIPHATLHILAANHLILSRNPQALHDILLELV